MKKVRIIKRIYPDKTVKYVIQQKHSLFRWMWVDAWVNSIEGAYCVDSFDTLEEAKKNLCYFDGTSCKESVVFTNEKIICPVCGEYCNGKGGFGCINKPKIFTNENNFYK
jgi:hypothetical protein